MSLNFPNESRCFDAKRQCVRFWAHDHALEIAFFVEAAALHQLDPQGGRDEPGLLGAFDRHRERICAAAAKVYTRHRGGDYTLGVDDLK